MARKHHTSRGLSNQLPTDEGTPRIYVKASRGLEKSFSDEQKEIFEKFHDCWSEYMSLAEAAIFEYAFKLGAKFMLESLIDHN